MFTLTKHLLDRRARGDHSLSPCDCRTSSGPTRRLPITGNGTPGKCRGRPSFSPIAGVVRIASEATAGACYSSTRSARRSGFSLHITSPKSSIGRCSLWSATEIWPFLPNTSFMGRIQAGTFWRRAVTSPAPTKASCAILVRGVYPRHDQAIVARISASPMITMR